MKKLLKKKVNVFGKGIPVFAIVILGLALVSAALIPLWGTITGSVVVTQGLFLDDKIWSEADDITYVGDLTSLEEKTISSGIHTLWNKASVDAEFGLVTTCVDGANAPCGDTPAEDATTTIEYLLKVTSEAGTGDEARITILPTESFDTLSELSSIEWMADVEAGYLPHVDVILDIDGDGVADDALVFEYAKVNPDNCDSGSYPTEDGLNTFDDNDIVGTTAYAWLSSGLSGGCLTPQFTGSYGTLADWQDGKTGNTYLWDGSSYVIKAPFNIGGDTKILRFEIEVDNWIPTLSNPDSIVSGIKINGVQYEVSGLKAGYTLDFQIVTDFPKMILPDTYTITTTVTA